MNFEKKSESAPLKEVCNSNCDTVIISISYLKYFKAFLMVCDEISLLVWPLANGLLPQRNA